MEKTSANEIPIYLSLGSNLGDRHTNLLAAIAALRQHMIINTLSPIYETEPAYLDDQPRFLNAVAYGHTMLSPHELLNTLKTIERELGRTTGPRFGPRTIDLDILLYGDLVLDTEELTIPHPRMLERPFVLIPLAQIAPDMMPHHWEATIGTLAGSVHGHGDIIKIIGPIRDIPDDIDKHA